MTEWMYLPGLGVWVALEDWKDFVSKRGSILPIPFALWFWEHD